VTIAVLIDTHILLWARITPEKLSSEEREVLDDAQVRLVSAITLWEIAILMTLGRVAGDMRLLDLPSSFDWLPIRPEHCKALIALPHLHRDPFDRMLIAQARAEEVGLLTRNDAIIAYGPQGALIVPRRDRPGG
jgi:PIN domain nuclease of toxin-antitoxin system